MTGYARGLLLTLLGVVTLSPDGLLIRSITADVWTLVFWRGLFMALGLAVWLAWRYGAGALAMLRRIGPLGLATAALFAASTLLFVNAIRLTAVANTLVILAAAPLLAAFLSSRLLGERVAPRTWAAAAAVSAGLALIFSASLRQGAPLGDLCAAGSAVCIACYLTALRAAREADMTPAAALGGLFAALAAAPFAAPLAVGPGDFALLAILGIGVMGLSFALITAGTRYLPAPEVGLVMLLEAALGPFWVWLAFGEVPPSATVLGGALILGALLLHSALALRQPRPA